MTQEEIIRALDKLIKDILAERLRLLLVSAVVYSRKKGVRRKSRIRCD